MTQVHTSGIQFKAFRFISSSFLYNGDEKFYYLVKAAIFIYICFEFTVILAFFL